MNTTATSSNPGTNYGLISGLIISVITLVLYLGGLELFLSPTAYITYLVVITMAVLAALKYRRSNEGFMEFREALKITFTVFALSFLIQTLFTYVLFNFIDVQFSEAYSQEALDRSEQFLRKMGMSDAKIDEEMDKQRNVNQFSILRMLTSYAVLCIVSFIFCLLISVIVKKSKPTFNNI